MTPPAKVIQRIKDTALRAKNAFFAFNSNRRMHLVERDPRIVYPCYKPLDEFMDVKRLAELDGYLTEFLERRTAKVPVGDFLTGRLKVRLFSAGQPGPKIIYLAASNPYTHVVDRAGAWHRTEAADELPLLMDFIATLPFKTTGRMMIIFDATGKPVTAHRDHHITSKCHEFVWFRTNLRKPFYLLNRRTGQRRYVESYSAWFDTVNQFHGAEATPGLSISIRVDGTWSDEFRQRIPVPSCNPASTSALWACIGDAKEVAAAGLVEPRYR